MAQDAPAIDPTSSSSVDERTRSAAPSDAEVLRALMGALKPPARSDEPTCEPPPLGSKAAGSARRRRLGGGVCARADARTRAPHARDPVSLPGAATPTNLPARRVPPSPERSAPEPAPPALSAPLTVSRVPPARGPRAVRARSGAARRAAGSRRPPRGRRLLRPPAQAELQRLGLPRRRGVAARRRRPRRAAGDAPGTAPTLASGAQFGEAAFYEAHYNETPARATRSQTLSDAARALAAKGRARVLFVAVAKNPYAWLLAMHRHPAAARATRRSRSRSRISCASRAFRRRGARRPRRGARRALQRRPAVESSTARCSRSRRSRARPTIAELAT